MNKGFFISEETPDREYFTVVPNYIINHSTIWERDLYLIMKRIAGELGSCFASHQTLAAKTGVSRPTISRTIQKLIAKGWIKEVGSRPAKTHPIKEYQIVDLWKMNVDFYREQKIRKTQNESFQKDMSTTEPKICKPQNIEEEPMGRRTIIKKEIIKKEKIFPLENITDEIMQEIAIDYHVSLGFVKFQFEKLKAYIANRTKRPYKNYKAALRNFVLIALERQMERRIPDATKAGVDARHI